MFVKLGSGNNLVLVTAVALFVSFLWGVESIFRKCSTHAAAVDPHSFVPNVVILLFSFQLRVLPEVIL